MPPLELERMAQDPIEQFGAWFEQATADVPLAEAMTLDSNHQMVPTS